MSDIDISELGKIGEMVAARKSTKGGAVSLIVKLKEVPGNDIVILTFWVLTVPVRELKLTRDECEVLHDVLGEYLKLERHP